MTAVFIAVYFVVILLLGILAKSRSKPGHEDFFLASRQVGPIFLLFTLAATNFSSFTIFGFAGAGYRYGYSYYPIMAFGTGFMALTFPLLGIPARRNALVTGAITPPELLWHRFRNRPLHFVYLAVMVIFTLPYLALQPIGAGYMLNALLGIPYQLGATLVVLFGLGYILLAGLRGDTWTDLIQGLVMLSGIAIIFIAILWSTGNFSHINTRLSETMPHLFSRPGGDGFFTPKIWFSYLALWFLCVPMFPQLFQRFIAARSDRSLFISAYLYPLVTTVLFFFPVAIGVLGNSFLPGLTGTQTDRILPLLVNKLLPPVFAGVMTICGLSALMSTMDSQLLTLSSMLIRDTRLLFNKPPETRPLVQIVVITLLAIIGLALAFKPPGTILEIATETFTGLAVLFPVTFFACYWRRTNPWSCLSAIIIGELLVILYHFKLLPTFGFLPVIPITILTTLVIIIGTILAPVDNLVPWAKLEPRQSGVITLFAIIFLLANDLWNWHRYKPLILGLPYWLWYQILLTILVTAFIIILRRYYKVQS